VFCVCTIGYVGVFIKSYDILVIILKTYLHPFIVEKKAIPMGFRKKHNK